MKAHLGVSPQQHRNPLRWRRCWGKCDKDAGGSQPPEGQGPGATDRPARPGQAQRCGLRPPDLRPGERSVTPSSRPRRSFLKTKEVSPAGPPRAAVGERHLPTCSPSFPQAGNVPVVRRHLCAPGGGGSAGRRKPCLCRFLRLRASRARTTRSRDSPRSGAEPPGSDMPACAWGPRE